MEFGKAFSYQFKDPDWFKKLILPGLCLLIPVVGELFILGWVLEITRRVINDEGDLLPGLDFGANIGKGFQAFLVQLVYALPIILFSIPMMLVAPIGAAVNMDTDTAGYVMIFVSVCCGGLILIYSILMGLMVPAALGNLVAKGSLGAGFRIGEVFGLVKSAPVAYLLVIVASIIASFIASLGSIACGLGILITAPYAMSILGNFYGQAYKQATLPK